MADAFVGAAGVSDSRSLSPAAGVAAAGRLPSGLRVVVDAYNRDLSQGTGISTYSRVLYDALGALGHSPSWLFARDSFINGDQVANEVTFHDPPAPSIGLIRQVEAAKRMWRGLTRTQSTAQRLNFGGVVLSDGSHGQLGSAYNAPGLYREALYRHELLGGFVDVTMPERADVFHLTSPLPVRMPGAQTVVSISDLVPLRLPNTTPDNKARFLHLVRESVKRADLIVTLSETSKADIVNILDVPPERVFVTYLATDIKELGREEQSQLPRTLGRFGLEAGKFILFVSAIEPKKNLRRLIEAFVETDSDLPLVIAGRKAWMWEREIGDLDSKLGEAARKRLRFLGYVSRQDLRYLYSGALALAFPSLYEGFGLPAVEAMKLGCPVLTADVPPLHETCGEAALYVDPYDTGDIRRGLERIMSDKELRQRLTDTGRSHAEIYSYGRYIDRLGQAYQRLA